MSCENKNISIEVYLIHFIFHITYRKHSFNYFVSIYHEILCCFNDTCIEKNISGLQIKIK